MSFNIFYSSVSGGLCLRQNALCFPIKALFVNIPIPAVRAAQKVGDGDFVFAVRHFVVGNSRAHPLAVPPTAAVRYRLRLSRSRRGSAFPLKCSLPPLNTTARGSFSRLPLFCRPAFWNSSRRTCRRHRIFRSWACRGFPPISRNRGGFLSALRASCRRLRLCFRRNLCPNPRRIPNPRIGRLLSRLRRAA